MKDSEIIFAVEESPEGGYEARAIGHSIFTQADSMDELQGMVRDAVYCHFDADLPIKLLPISLSRSRNR